MRIIAGEYKGRVLKAPKGDGTRPTTDRVREALMSVVASARGGLDGAVVLDAFAGSGALGLEAASRGAALVHFFERDGAALRTLSDNVKTLGIETVGCGARARLHRDDVLKKPPVHVRPAFDVVFLDPPYALDPTKAAALIDALADAGALAADAFVLYEYAKSAERDVLEAFASLQWEPVSEKRYGDTGVALFERKFETA